MDQEPTTNPTKTSAKLPVDYKTRHEALLNYLYDTDAIMNFMEQHPEVAFAGDFITKPTTHMDYMLRELLLGNIVPPITREEANIQSLIGGIRKEILKHPQNPVYPTFSLSFQPVVDASHPAPADFMVVTPTEIIAPTHDDYMINVPVVATRVDGKSGIWGMATVTMVGSWQDELSEPYCPFLRPIGGSPTADSNFSVSNNDGSSILFLGTWNGSDPGSGLAPQIGVTATNVDHFYEQTSGSGYDYSKIFSTLTFEIPQQLFNDSRVMFEVDFRKYYKYDQNDGGAAV